MSEALIRSLVKRYPMCPFSQEKVPLASSNEILACHNGQSIAIQRLIEAPCVGVAMYGLICLDYDKRSCETNAILMAAVEEGRKLFTELGIDYYEETTQGDGYHQIIACDPRITPGKTHLAERDLILESDTDSETYRSEALRLGWKHISGTTYYRRGCFIDLLGRATKVIVAPSPKYQTTHGNLATLKETPKDLFNKFLDEVKIRMATFNYVHPKIVVPVPDRTEVPNSRKLKKRLSLGMLLPGDEFNAHGTEAEIFEGIRIHKETPDYLFLTRQGKDWGVGGTFNRNSRYIHIFSSNWNGFEEDENVKPFGFLAQTKFGGDFKKCADYLRTLGYGKILMTEDLGLKTPNNPLPEITWPKLFGGWLEDLANQVSEAAQCHRKLVDICMLSSIGMGGMRNSRVSLGRIKLPPVDYFLILAEQSEKKSTVTGILHDAIIEKDRELMEQYSLDFKKWEREKASQRNKLFTLNHKPSQNADAIDRCNNSLDCLDKHEPKKIIHIIDNATPEALAKAFKDNSVLSYVTTEFSGDSLQQSYGKSPKDNDVLLKLWSGDFMRNIRLNDSNTLLNKQFLNMLAMIQPAVVQSKFKHFNRPEESGLMSRYLIFRIPETKKEFGFPDVDECLLKQWNDFLLKENSKEYKIDKNDPCLDSMQILHNSIQMDEHLIPLDGKFVSHILRLSLMLALANNLEPQDTMEEAIAIYKHVVNEFKRNFLLFKLEDFNMIQRICKGIKKGKLQVKFNIRDAQRLLNVLKSEAETALNIGIENGWFKYDNNEKCYECLDQNPRLC